MTISVDTNIFVRSLTDDDAQQSKAAQKLLKNSDAIVMSTTMFCELVWVLRGPYRYSQDELIRAIESLIQSANAIVDHASVEAGLATLKSGGDFADGVIAYEGERLGADRFVSFDKKAVRLLKSQGRSAQVLS